MFDSCEKPVTPSQSASCSYQPGGHSAIAQFLDHAVAGVDLRSLMAGSEVDFETRNSRYRLVLLGRGPTALIRGGRHFERESRVRVEGATLGGSLLKLGWIALGCRLELSIIGKRIITSPVRSLSVKRIPF